MRFGVLHDSFPQGPEVLAALAEPDALHSQKARVSRPHSDAATAVGVCILVEYSVTLAVLDFFVQEKGEHH